MALLLLPAFALRVLIVAQWDKDVATALVVNSGTTQLLYASFLQVIARALYLWPLIAAYYYVLRARRLGWPVWRIVWALIALWVASFPGVLWFPVSYFEPFVPAIVIALSALAAIARHEGAWGPKVVPLVQVVFVGVVVAGQFIGASSAMWLPRERLDVAGIPKQVYVLNDSGEDLVVFDPNTRAVMRIPGKDVSNRQFCHQEDKQTFGNLIFGAPKGLPQCP